MHVLVINNNQEKENEKRHLLKETNSALFLGDICFIINNFFSSKFITQSLGVDVIILSPLFILSMSKFIVRVFWPASDGRQEVSNRFHHRAATAFGAGWRTLKMAGKEIDAIADCRMDKAP